MQITITDTCDGPNRPVTLAELEALEQRIMSVISDKITAVTASIEEVKTRVAALETNAPTQADLDQLDAAKVALDAIAVPPVVPTPEPTP